MKIFFASVILLISAWSFGQEDFAAQGPVVSMLPAPVVTAVQGKAATVPLTFRIAGKYHINSHEPKSEFLIPTALKLGAATDIVIGKTAYPQGEEMSFPFDPDEKLSVYSGDFKIEVQVRPLRSVPAGKYALHGTLRYQACDNASCFPPKQLPVAFDVKIAKAPAARAKNPAQSPDVHR